GCTDRQLADLRVDGWQRGAAPALVPELDRVAGVQIRGLSRQRPPASFGRSLHGQTARLPTEVTEDDAVAVDEALAPAQRDPEHCLGLRRRRVWTLVRCQPDPCRTDHLAPHVTLRTPFEYLSLRRDRSGPELGSREVHQDPTFPTERGRCRS